MLQNEWKCAQKHRSPKEHFVVVCYGKALWNYKRKCVVNAKKNYLFKELLWTIFLYIITARKGMDTDIFENQFHRRFVPDVQYFTNEKALPQKSVLLLDNVPSHSSAMSSDNGLITIKYSPPPCYSDGSRYTVNCFKDATVTGWPSQMTRLLH